MNTVWKYDVVIDDNFSLSLPKNAKILSVQMQNGNAQMWCLVDDSEKVSLTRYFRLAGTGHPIQENRLKFVGTFQPNSYLVFHLFEIIDEYNT